MFFNMKIEDFYQNVVGVVCRVTGVDEYNMLHSNKEACVDARYLLVHFLSQNLTDEEISSLTGASRQSVNYIRNKFLNRINKWSVKIMLSDVGKELANNSQRTVS